MTGQGVLQYTKRESYMLLKWWHMGLIGPPAQWELRKEIAYLRASNLQGGSNKKVIQDILDNYPPYIDLFQDIPQGLNSPEAYARMQKRIKQEQQHI